MNNIDVSKYTVPKCTLYLSPLADQELMMFTCGKHHFTPDAESVRELCARSASAAIDGQLMKTSPWFKAQRVHRFDAVVVSTPGGAYQDSLVLHLGRAPTGWLVTDPSETPLPDTYVDERVVEEVRMCY